MICLIGWLLMYFRTFLTLSLSLSCLSMSYLYQITQQSALCLLTWRLATVTSNSQLQVNNKNNIFETVVLYTPWYDDTNAVFGSTKCYAKQASDRELSSVYWQLSWSVSHFWLCSGPIFLIGTTQILTVQNIFSQCTMCISVSISTYL